MLSALAHGSPSWALLRSLPAGLLLQLSTIKGQQSKECLSTAATYCVCTLLADVEAADPLSLVLSCECAPGRPPLSLQLPCQAHPGFCPSSPPLSLCFHLPDPALYKALLPVASSTSCPDIITAS